jgi:hypothetical protein
MVAMAGQKVVHYCLMNDTMKVKVCDVSLILLIKLDLMTKLKWWWLYLFCQYLYFYWWKKWNSTNAWVGSESIPYTFKFHLTLFLFFIYLFIFIWQNSSFILRKGNIWWRDTSKLLSISVQIQWLALEGALDSLSCI